MEDKSSPKLEAVQPAAEKKQRYQAPQLVTHGTVEEVTQALALGGNDGTLGSDILNP